MTKAGKSGFTTGLLILSSAALGGIAVALWNRKTLSALHEMEQQAPAELGSDAVGIEEIL